PTPHTPDQVEFSQLNGIARFVNNNQLVRFDVSGLPNSGGNISLQGETVVKTLETNLQVRADILANEVSRLIKLPIFLLDGRAQGDLKIQKIQLKAQQGKPQDPLIYGSARVQGVKLQVPMMPQPFNNSQGTVRFDGTGVQLDNVTTNYGKIPLVAKGSIDIKAGYKLAARVNAVNVALARETLNIKLPFPTLGEVKADLLVAGPVTKPILTGKVATIKSAKIDKVDFKSIRSEFEFSPVASVISFKNIQGQAAVAGEFTGAGKIFLGDVPQLNFNGTAKNISGDAIASVYDIKPGFQIGTVSGQAQITGTAEKVTTVVQWKAPQATYPGTGEATVYPDRTVAFRNVALNVGGGTVRASGDWSHQRWRAIADASAIQVQRFVNPSQVQNVSLNDARFHGRLILSGTCTPFKIDSIRPENAKVELGSGTVTISKLQLNEQNFSAQLMTEGLRLARLLKTPVPPTLTGPLAGTIQVSGNTKNFDIKTMRASGEGRIAVGGGTVTATNIQVSNGKYQTQLRANNVELQQLTQLPQQLQGKLTGQFNVAGSVESFQPQDIVATGQARVKIAGGTVTASQIQLGKGRYQAQLQAENVALQRLLQVTPQFQGNLTGQFNVAGNVESFQPQAIAATGQARVRVGGGTVTASNIQVANGRYQMQLQANHVPLQRLTQLPPQFNGGLSGQFNVAGLVDSLEPQAIQASGQGQLNVAGGTIKASKIQLANGRYQASVDATGVGLNRLSPQLQGQFGGKLQLAGVVDKGNLSSLKNVRASGEVQLSKGIPGIEQPLTAAIAWDGQKLDIERATSKYLNASGYILANANRAGIPEITGLNLNVQAQDVNLQQLPLQLPSLIALSGKADFGGRISGKLPVPDIQGQVRLRNLVVNQQPFESALTGNIQMVQGQGLNLDVVGKRDRIAFNTDSNRNPNSFQIKWHDALFTGQSQGDVLAAKVENFPLQILRLTPPANTQLGTGAIAGLLSGNFQFNQKTFATQGDVAIANPQFGRIRGDRLAAQFRYSDGNASITNSVFIKDTSRYSLEGTFNQMSNGPQVKAKLNVTRGEVQDILTALQIYEFQDIQRGPVEPSYGKASDLVTVRPVSLSQQPLLAQLQRLSEIDYLLSQQQQKRKDASPIPELADLNGTFNGEVTVDTATATGLSVKFSLNGKDFAWGKEDNLKHLYKAEQVVAQGSFENGVLTLLPFRLESQNRLITFTGNIGGKEQSGQLRVLNFPVEVLSQFVKLPIGMTGNLSGTAAIAGSIDNPQTKGELEITQGTLNQKGVESANASFSYSNGRLSFGSIVAVSGIEPVNITGSIPYKLPFATVAPDNDNINLDVKVKNEGLAILNLLNNQVAFENGQGQIDLTVKGTTQQPRLSGNASISNATFTSAALPGKLTNVGGKIHFDFDRVIVENLQGNYNNQGLIEATGEIPIASLETKINNPLNVKLRKLAVNLKGLYEGGVSGKLAIGGSVIKPTVGGKLWLNHGEVLLAESPTPTEKGVGSIDDTRIKQVKQKSLKAEDSVATFNNLKLTLGNDVEITRPPILSFRATGSLNVNGSFSQPIPEGTIRLEEGSVNLFTTRFNLVRTYSHKAIFRENQPNDPDLDIQLFAKVLDVIQTSDFNKPNPTGLASLETIRVEARVQGPASQLDKNLELVSTPARSQNEIVALLGAGTANTEGGGDSTLGLINIAGSAVLNNLQGPLNLIGTALGLSELRLFPTIISDNPEAGRSTSSLELAAEAGVDLTRRISVSGLKILTSGDPVQWGVNYRLNDTIRLRGTTNFSDDSRAVVEYQKRF
ncbi:MAG: translocation/assembly module TamB domain-containing protein, partial [Scytonema sp. PMC 1069.18]|nr:translocation/assembly module TamB domain-containing protein [Scytonema sp. PMC 1069.18]